MSPKRRPPRAGGASLPWDSLHPTLDLHGATAEEANHRVRHWLGEQQASGVRTVRVITGKGNRSRGLPVLRSEIERLLHALKGTVVAAYTPDAGGGAFRIELRKVPPRRRGDASPRPPRTAALPPVDPALLRRAEEALWELGIQPTPELIRAEVRRLQQEADTNR